jgi:glycosyltransferase involved in cell wall biosynthesis
MNPRLLFVVNDLTYFASHRLPVALAAKADGYEIHVAAPPGNSARLAGAGLVVHEVRLKRGSLNLVNELRGVADLLRLMVRLEPRLVHLVTAKSIIYGGIAARFARVPAVVAAVTGLGHLFTADTRKARALRLGVTQLYRFALKQRSIKVIFQNTDDLRLFVDLGLVKQDDTTLIHGSGVSLSHFPFLPEPAGIPHVVFAGRLLGDKGIIEFIEALRLLRARGVHARYSVVGDADPKNPTSISEATIRAWQAEGLADFVGYQTDVAAQLAAANVVVLPSYREGSPKVLAEAASCGRAVVTTDVPGCREVIEPNITGLLVPPRDSAALAGAIERLVEDGDLRSSMGAAGRKLAERSFAIEKIVAAHLRVYGSLSSAAQSAPVP